MLNIKERLKELRQKNNLSQNELAKSLGIKRHTISAYETGNITPPIDKIILIAKYYDVSIDYLCGLSDELKNDDCLGFDSYCISRLKILKEKNNLQLLSCLIKYGNNQLYEQAKLYLNQKYNDTSKQKIDEYILIENIKNVLNSFKNSK